MNCCTTTLRVALFKCTCTRHAPRAATTMYVTVLIYMPSGSHRPHPAAGAQLDPWRGHASPPRAASAATCRITLAHHAQSIRQRLTHHEYPSELTESKPGPSVPRHRCVAAVRRMARLRTPACRLRSLELPNRCDEAKVGRFSRSASRCSPATPEDRSGDHSVRGVEGQRGQRRLLEKCLVAVLLLVEMVEG